MDIFSREVGICGLERAYSLLGDDTHLLKTDRPASPFLDQVAMAWRLMPHHIPHNLASGHLPVLLIPPLPLSVTSYSL